MAEEIEIRFHLTRETRTGQLGILAMADINEPLWFLLDREGEQDCVLAGLVVAGKRWAAHSPESFGEEPHPLWLATVVDRLAGEIRRLEMDGVLS